jgi:uncharacterized membrane protein YphA (DoxX/SURF4 family)
MKFMQVIARIETTLQASSRFAPLLLRLGLAVVFLYAALSSLTNPNDWVGYLPAFVKDILPATVVLGVFSIIELLLVAWLLSGVYVRFAALICAGMLLGIIISNFSLLAISFRDIGLVFAALALSVMKDDR